jgi:hypothetical protein
VLEQQSDQMLKDFFKDLRKKDKFED